MKYNILYKILHIIENMSSTDILPKPNLQYISTSYRQPRSPNIRDRAVTRKNSLLDDSTLDLKLFQVVDVAAGNK